MADNKTLTTLVKDITYHYIKHFYDKKLKQNKKFKNRELAILKELYHPNVIRMQHAFFTSGEKIDDSFLNIIMDYIPMNIHRINEEFKSLN